MAEQESERQAYDRGEAAGKLAAEVAEQGRHLKTINGSMERVAKSLAELVLGIAALNQQMTADKETRISTAEALKNAEDARRDADETKWTPWQRIMLVVGCIVGVLGLYVLAKANHLI